MTGIIKKSKKNAMKRSVALSVCAAMMMGFLVACADKTAAPESGPAAGGTDLDPEPKIEKTSLVLNWFAEPEHGGSFAALDKGYYKDAGLDVTIMPGGPQVVSTQIVASGKAEFGIANGDDILVARQEGVPVVAIAAAFQKSPQVLIYHEDSGIKGFEDLNGKTVYVAPAASYWLYINSKFKLDQAQEMKYTGSLVNFVNDPNAVTQGYITSEPYTLDKQGVPVKSLLIADSGYDLYANVYFTTEEMIAKQPEKVKAFVEATLKGWEYYKDHYEEINPSLHKMNPDMDLEMMKYSAETEMDLIFTGDALEQGTGIMTEARWSEVQKQLMEVGVLKKEEPIGNAFTTQFLTGK